VFTGIIETRGTITALAPSPAGLRLEISPSPWAYQPKLGDSIACNGCCLTVAATPSGGRLAFDAVPETLAKTTVGLWTVGQRIHLEPAATASTLLGGHMVQGHIDGIGTVLANGTLGTAAGGWRLTIRPPADLLPYFVPKGSVAIDGVSLTLAEVTPTDFAIAIIPTTLDKTHLGTLRPGDKVNLEADIIAKTIVHYMQHFAARPG
jgi:riboflavin synthase